MKMHKHKKKVRNDENVESETLKVDGDENA